MYINIYTTYYVLNTDSYKLFKEIKMKKAYERTVAQKDQVVLFERITLLLKKYKFSSGFLGGAMPLHLNYWGARAPAAPAESTPM